MKFNLYHYYYYYYILTFVDTLCVNIDLTLKCYVTISAYVCKTYKSIIYLQMSQFLITPGGVVECWVLVLVFVCFNVTMCSVFINIFSRSFWSWYELNWNVCSSLNFKFEFFLNSSWCDSEVGFSIDFFCSNLSTSSSPPKFFFKKVFFFLFECKEEKNL